MCFVSGRCLRTYARKSIRSVLAYRPRTDRGAVGQTRNRLLLDGLFEGGQGVLADQHDLALLAQGDGQGADVSVFAGEFEDLRFELGEPGIAHRGGREIGVTAEARERGHRKIDG